MEAQQKPPELASQADRLSAAQQMTAVHRSQHLRRLQERTASVEELRSIVRLEIELDTIERVQRLQELTRRFV